MVGRGWRATVRATNFPRCTWRSAALAGSQKIGTTGITFTTVHTSNTKRTTRTGYGCYSFSMQIASRAMSRQSSVRAGSRNSRTIDLSYRGRSVKGEHIGVQVQQLWFMPYSLGGFTLLELSCAPSFMKTPMFLYIGAVSNIPLIIALKTVPSGASQSNTGKVTISKHMKQA